MAVRIPTHVWAGALVRSAGVGGASAFVLQHGDKDRGDVIVKVARLDGTAALFAPSPMAFEEREFDWLPVPGAWSDEGEVDEIVRKRRSYDPDLWVIEIEDREGRHFLTEKVSNLT